MKKHFVLAALSAIILSTSVGAVAIQPTQSVKAASFTHYVYSWRDTPHLVVVKKPITIRKVMFNHNNAGVYFGQKKHLKRGTKIRIRAYGDSGAYWIMGRNWRWTYPHKTDKWFKLYKPNSHRKTKKQNKTLTPAQKAAKNRSDVAKMTAKPYLGGDLSEGYYANIPKRGTMNFSFEHDAPNFAISGDFINITGQPVKLEDYLNNYFTYQLPTSDLGDGNHYVTFHTTQIVAPYSHARFKATSNGPKNANDIDKLLMETKTDNTDVKLPFMGVRVPVF